jgi:hypothetical protein
MSFDPVGLLAIVAGVFFGYATGRFLLLERRVRIAPFPVIAVVAVLGLVTLRLFAALGQDDAWRGLAFPVIVGWGAGLTFAPARPLRGAWWEVWKQ